jgi:hypothetical protein
MFAGNRFGQKLKVGVLDIRTLYVRHPLLGLCRGPLMFSCSVGLYSKAVVCRSLVHQLDWNVDRFDRFR